MTLHNDLLHTEYSLTHNERGVRCHYYSDVEIKTIQSIADIPAAFHEQLWEYLDVKAAFYLRARNDKSWGTNKEQRQVIEFASSLCSWSASEIVVR